MLNIVTLTGCVCVCIWNFILNCLIDRDFHDHSFYWYWFKGNVNWGVITDHTHVLHCFFSSFPVTVIFVKLGVFFTCILKMLTKSHANRIDRSINSFHPPGSMAWLAGGIENNWIRSHKHWDFHIENLKFTEFRFRWDGLNSRLEHHVSVHQTNFFSNSCNFSDRLMFFNLIIDSAIKIPRKSNEKNRKSPKMIAERKCSLPRLCQ